MSENYTLTTIPVTTVYDKEDSIFVKKFSQFVDIGQSSENIAKSIYDFVYESLNEYFPKIHIDVSTYLVEDRVEYVHVTVNYGNSSTLHTTDTITLDKFSTLHIDLYKVDTHSLDNEHLITLGANYYDRDYNDCDRDYGLYRRIHWMSSKKL